MDYKEVGVEIIYFVVNLPLLFLEALRGGKVNACLAIISLMIMLLLPIFIGALLSNRKLVRIALFCQAMLLSVIFMIHNQWIIVLGIVVAIVFYRRKISGRPV